MSKQNKWILIAIVAVSVLIRVGAAFMLGNTVEELPGTFDQISYHRLALRVIGGHGFSFGEPWWPITAADAPTAHWSYLYTLYLAGVYSLFGPSPLAARLIQAAAVGILLPLLAFWLSKELFTERVGLIAAGISAIYLYFGYYAATLMTESFYIVAILGGMLLTIRLVEASRGGTRPQKLKFALGLGLTLGAAVLLRQLFMLFIPFLLLWAWWRGRKIGGQSLIPWLTLAVGVIALLILPFTIYNYARFGQFVLLNTNAGYAFFWGNHPIYGTHFEPILPAEMGSYQGLIPQELHHLDEAALERELLRRGIGFVLDDPLRYGLLSLSRIPPYFMFWPSPGSGLVSNLSRVLSFGVFWPFMLAGLIVAPRSRFARHKLRLETPLMLVYSFLAVYAGIHILTWTLIRYRLPLDALLLIFAALVFEHLWQWWRQKQR